MGKYIRLYCKKTLNMQGGKVEKGKGEGEDQGAMKHFRLIITGKDPKQIELISQDIFKSANELRGKGYTINISGPRKMPNKTLRITTRKSLCGNGTNTFDKFEMRIHKRIIEIRSSMIDKKIGSLFNPNHITQGMIIEAEIIEH